MPSHGGGGFGGGHGGGFHGGGGGGFHGGGGGFHGGGGGFHGGGFHRGHHRPRGGFFFGPRWGYRRGFGGGCLGVMILPFLLIFVFTFAMCGRCAYTSEQHDTFEQVTSFITPMSSSLCPYNGTLLEDEVGVIVDDAGVKAALRLFYEKTGIEPYIWVVSASSLSDESTSEPIKTSVIADKALEKYTSLFSDEGHFLCVIAIYENYTYPYYFYYLPGDNAYDFLLSDNVCKQVMDELYEQYTDTKDYAQALINTFQTAADELSTKTDTVRIPAATTEVQTENRLSTGTIISIVLAVAAAVGVVIFLVVRSGRQNKNQSGNGPEY